MTGACLSVRDASAALITAPVKSATAMCYYMSSCVCRCVSAEERDVVTIQKGWLAEGRRLFIRPRTRRSSAWCCPAGSVAGSCICLGRRGHSHCEEGHFGCSWFRHAPEPALRSTPEGREGEEAWDTILTLHPTIFAPLCLVHSFTVPYIKDSSLLYGAVEIQHKFTENSGTLVIKILSLYKIQSGFRGSGSEASDRKNMNERTLLQDG